jgi:hypothetical protein
VNEKLAEVVGCPIAYFGREENDLDILRQQLTEFCELVFILRTEDMLDALNAEVLYVTRIDGFTLEHSKEASSGSNDDVRPLLKVLLILVEVGPTNREVGSNPTSYSGRRY